MSACGGSDHHALPPKKPNNELILGEFARRPPEGTTAARFRADGSVTIRSDVCVRWLRSPCPAAEEAEQRADPGRVRPPSAGGHDRGPLPRRRLGDDQI